MVVMLATGLIAADPAVASGSQTGQTASPPPLVVFSQRRTGPPNPGGSPVEIKMTVDVRDRVALVTRLPTRLIPAFRLSPEELRTLRRELAAARFATLRPVYDGRNAGSQLDSSITYAGRVVRLVRGARGPARLRPALAFLERIVDEHGGYAPGPG